MKPWSSTTFCSPKCYLLKRCVLYFERKMLRVIGILERQWSGVISNCVVTRFYALFIKFIHLTLSHHYHVYKLHHEVHPSNKAFKTFIFQHQITWINFNVTNMFEQTNAVPDQVQHNHSVCKYDLAPHICVTLSVTINGTWPKPRPSHY